MRSYPFLAPVFALGLALGFAQAAAATPPPADISGFEGTRWGMTAEDLRARFPTSLRGPRGGEPGDAVAEGLAIDGIAFDARFFLGSDGLQRVFIVARPGTANAYRFAALEAHLTRLYGRPAYERRHPGELTAEWSFPSTRFTLIYERVTDRSMDWEGLFLIFIRVGRAGDLAAIGTRP